MSQVEFDRAEQNGVPQMPRRIPVKQVDAFTETALMGNPAAVVLEGAGLSEREMQNIAREMAVSETAFILPSSLMEADLRIRWFTPGAEVPLCGHATIAAFHVLAETGLRGMEGDGAFDFTLETASGILPVHVNKGPGGIDVRFGLPVPRFVRAGQFKLDLLRILNISIDQMENRMPIVATDYLFVPVRRLHTLFEMTPNFTMMSQFLSHRHLAGICVFSTETVERGSALHSRFFAPTIGISEDPVTGSANGPLGAYLVEFGKMKVEGEHMVMIGEQGDVIGRPGRVRIELDLKDRQVAAVWIAGRAVTVLSGEMLLP
jgi:trans-2,3-dihydro-3-hydroxyanthranilate isomerase